jgi:hypothetical protein
MATIKEKYNLDEMSVSIVSDIIKTQKFTNSDNIDFIIALISARDTSIVTKDGSRIIKRFLNPTNYPKTKNPTILHLYNKYEYVYKYTTLCLLHKRNIKSKLLSLHTKITEYP